MKIEIDKISPQDIIDLMHEHDKQGIDLVTRAFEFAKETHNGKSHISGEPYLIHLYETAIVLAEINSNAQTIAAGLLSDSLENPDVDVATLKKEFGEEIFFLIEGVSK